MFLVLKNEGQVFAALESSDAVLGVMYASLKEEYKDIELDILFSKPNCIIEKNLIRFINMLHNGPSEEITLSEDKKEEILEQKKNEIKVEETNNIKIDEENSRVIKEKENTIEIEDIKAEKENIIEIEEVKKPKETIEIEPVRETIEIEEVPPVVVRRVDPAERALEKIKAQQREEGLPKLDNKVNTLEYRKYLENFMKLGFAANTLSKKAADINDKEIRNKLEELSNAAMKRVENYEEKFREIGLTTAQIHTFRMEALREIKKYRDSAYEEVYKYLRKLYDLSEELIKEL